MSTPSHSCSGASNGVSSDAAGCVTVSEQDLQRWMKSDRFRHTQRPYAASEVIPLMSAYPTIYASNEVRSAGGRAVLIHFHHRCWTLAVGGCAG
jgi:isocitrate lyase